MFSQVISGLFGLLITYLVYYLIIKPYLALRFYRQQGIPMEFFPMCGTYLRDFINVKRHKDFCYAWKEYARRDPTPKAFGTNFGSQALIYFFDLEACKDVFSKQDNYIKYPPFLNLFKELIGGRSEGIEWKKRKKFISQVFHYEFLKEVIPIMVKVVDECFEKWKQRDLSNMVMINEFQAITGEVVGTIFFGERFSEYKVDGVPLTAFMSNLIVRIALQYFNPLYQLFGSKIVKLGLTSHHRKIMRDIRKVRGLGKNIILQRFNEIKSGEKVGKKNLMDLYLELAHNNVKGAFNIDEIVDEFFVFFMAGMDSTSHLITIMTYYVLAFPQYRDGLMEDINKIFKDPSTVDLDQLNKMDYLTAFIKESLRMGGPGHAIVTRVSLCDHVVAGIKVKKGTLISLSLITNNFDPKYHDDPDLFNPERFLKPGKTLDSIKENPYCFTPFAAGSRGCLGQHVAMNLMKILLSLFMKKFNFEHVNKDYELRYTLRLAYEPEESVRFKLTPIESSN